MNILKNAWGGRLIRLPEVKQIATMSGKFAYACTSCETLMERAPHGKCEACGETSIVPAQTLLRLARFVIDYKALQKEKQAAAEAMKANPSLYLTLPDDEPQKQKPR